MSFRDTAAMPLATAFIALSVLVLSGPACAEDPPVQPAASPVLAAEACLRADLAGIPPPAAADCTEYQARLEQQAKRLKLLAEIKASKAQIAKAEAPTPDATAAKPAAASLPAIPPPALDAADRVLEVFGDQASIRYRGGDLLVRQGQTLPGGGRVEQVSLAGVVIADGRSRRSLPFYVGGRQ